MKNRKTLGKGNAIGGALITNKVFFVLILLVTVVSVLTPKFLQADNILNVLRQVSSNTLIALGFTFVIASGYFDLSVGANLALTGIMMSKMLVSGVSLPVVLITGLILGIIFSTVNAIIISIFDVPAFIVTLATQSVYRGACYLITGMKPISGLPSEFVSIGQGYLGNIPIPVIIMVVMIIVMHIVLTRTAFGRHVIAIGGNAGATRVCGISLSKVRYGVYALSGLCVGMASIITTARAASGQVAAGNNVEMDVIAACVIGGTSMAGGTGNILGTFVGCLIVGVVSNSLNLLKVDSNWQIVAKGLMILLSLILDCSSTKILQNVRKKKTIEK